MSKCSFGVYDSKKSAKISTKGVRLCPPNNTFNPVFSDLPTVLTFTGELVGRRGLGDLDLLFFGGKFKS